MANLETLELTINGSAESASQGISSLVGSLSSLSASVSRAVSGLRRLNSELANLKTNSSVKLGEIGNVGKSVDGIKKQTAALKENKKAWAGYDPETNNNTKAIARAADPIRDAEWQRAYDANHQKYLEERAYKRYMNNYYREKERLKKAGLFREAGQEAPQAATEVKQEVSSAASATKELSQATKEASASTTELSSASELESAKMAKLAAATEKAKAETEKLNAETEAIKAKTASLKESAQENMGGMAKSVNRVTTSASRLLQRIGRIAQTMLIRKAINALLSAAREGLDNFYNYSKGIESGYAASLDKVSAKWGQFKNQLGAGLGTALAAAIPILNAIASAALAAVNAITALFALLGGSATYAKATEGMSDIGKAAGGAGGAVKELLADFDELNVIQNQGGGGGGGGGGFDFGAMFQETELPRWMVEWEPLIKSILGGVLGALILPKIFDWIKKIFTLFGGQDALNALDILKRMHKLKDTDFDTPTDGINKFLKTFSDSDVLDGVGDVSDLLSTLKNLDWKTLLIKNLPELLKLAITALTKLLQGMDVTTKVKVDGKEFEAFKKKFDEFKKENKTIDVYVKFNQPSYITFLAFKELIDAWVDNDSTKSIGVQISPTTSYVFRIARDAIDDWVNRLDTKSIAVKLSESTTYVFSMARKGIDDWVSTTSTKHIGVQLDPGFTYIFRTGRDAIDSWVSKNDIKSIDVKISKTEFDRTRKTIDSWVNDNAEKTVKISVAFNTVQYLSVLAKMALISEWCASQQTKNIGIKFDGMSLSTIVAQIAIITAWAAIKDVKLIDIVIEDTLDVKTINEWVSKKDVKLLDIVIEDTLDIKIVDEWVSRKDTKIIDVKINDQGNLPTGDTNSNNKPKGKEWYERSLMDWIGVATDTDLPSGLGEWVIDQLFGSSGEEVDISNIVTITDNGGLAKEIQNVLSESGAKALDAAGIAKVRKKFPNVSALDIFNLTDFGNLASEMQREFLGALIEAFGPSAIDAIKSKIPNISADSVIKLIQWDKFTTGRKFEFLNALREAFGSSAVLAAAKNAGIDIGALVKAGMESKDPTIRKQAQEWSKLIEEELKKPHEVNVKENKASTSATVGAISSAISSINSTVHAKAGFTTGHPKNLQTTIEGMTPKLPTKTVFAPGNPTNLKNGVESQKPVISTGTKLIPGQVKDLKNGIEGVKPTITASTNVNTGKVKADVEAIHPTITANVQAAPGGIASLASYIKGAIRGTITVKAAGKPLANVAIAAYAGGGVVDSGSLFLANENGNSEMIGKFGSHAAVANQEQMVEAMARGVQYAQSEQNGLLREQNNLLRGILQKTGNNQFGISSALGRTVKQSLDMYNMATGVG